MNTESSTSGEPEIAPSATEESTIQLLLEEVARRSDDRISHRAIDPELSGFLLGYADFVRVSKERRRVSVASDGIGFFFLVALAEGLPIDAALLDAASSFELYGLSLTLFDAVQDSELEPPFSDPGPEVVTNAALVLFLLASHGIATIGADASAEIRSRIRESYLGHSLIAGSAQHGDLSRRKPNGVAAAVAQARGKTSLHAMLAEVAAHLAANTEARVAAYRRIGEETALIRQLANDLKDIFVMRESSDMRLRRCTLPLALFDDEASPAQREELARLTLLTPESSDAIRSLLIESGAVQRAAEMMEQSRREIHRLADSLGLRGGPLDLFLQFIDSLAAQLYRRSTR